MGTSVKIQRGKLYYWGYGKYQICQGGQTFFKYTQNTLYMLHVITGLTEELFYMILTCQQSG